MILRTKHKPEAFALVPVLLVCTLLLIVLVIFSGMVQVETASTALAQQRAMARQNAFVGMKIALGRLQSAAGPDQRTTAASDLLRADGDTAFNERRWTGVWKTFNPTTPASRLDVEASPVRTWSTGNGSLAGGASTSGNSTGGVQWLVSQPGGGSPLNPKTWTAVTSLADAARNAVKTATLPSGEEVRVPLVKFSENGKPDAGGLAFWVSDEGVKAKVLSANGTLGLNPDTDFVRNRLTFTAPSANAIHSAITGFPDLREDPKLGRIAWPEHLRFLGVNSTNATLSEDFTVHGFGVLADSRNGGLRRDLTAAFEDRTRANPSGQFNKFVSWWNAKKGFAGNDAGRLFAFPPIEPTAQRSPNTVGVPWLALHNFYNLYRPNLLAPTGTTGGNGPAGVGSPAVSASVEPRAVNYSGTVPARNVVGSIMAPQFLGAFLSISLDAVPLDPPANTKYDLRFILCPALVLYNPFNVRISLPPGSSLTYRVALFADLSGGGGSQWRYFWLVLASGLTDPLYYQTFGRKPGGPGANGEQYFQMTIPGSESISMEPGEVRVFGLPNSAVDVGNLPTTFSLTSTYNADNAKIVPFGLADRATPITLSGDRIISFKPQVDILANRGALRISTPFSIWGDGDTRDRQIQFTPFPGISIDNTTYTLRRVDSLAATPQLIGVINLGTKTVAPALIIGTKKNAPTPVFSGMSGEANPVSVRYTPITRSLATAFGALTDGEAESRFQVVAGAGGKVNAFWGSTTEAGQGLTQVVLRDIPRQPLTSLGQFMHLSPSIVLRDTLFDPTNDGAEEDAVYRMSSLYPVGGSFASASIPTDASMRYLMGDPSGLVRASAFKKQEASRARYWWLADDNFVMNEALFDATFFSTVPAGDNPYSAAPFSNFNQAYVDALSLLPNPRMAYYSTNGTAPIVADLRDTEKAAANLLLNGAFNINSTSEKAWGSLLGSLSGNKIQALTAGGAGASTGVLNNAILRFLTPFGKEVNKPWSGTRSLTDLQVQTLAREIVKEIRLRGPFLGLADFLNRRLGTTSLSHSGALQAALNASGVNNDIRTAAAGTAAARDATGDSRFNLDITDDAYTWVGSTAAGIPGDILQNDLVQAFAPVFSARSDTFVVRSYGEYRPSQGAAGATLTQAAAMLEALVQRVPEYVDPANAPEADPTTGANQAFGRRFKVVMMRWIDAPKQ
jgi:hypothetical protein